LMDLKDAYPIQVAEYATANRIANEPAFNWWVHTVLRKRNRIVAKVKRYCHTTHKFGIRLPKTVEEALTIDEETGTDFWRKALGKEMAKVKVTWRAADGLSPEQAQTGKETSMIGFQEIRCHLIFDVKMDFTRMARFVAGGHTTDAPGLITYSSVVSRDSVRLAFLVAGLNDLDVLAGDVTNAYLNAKCREKIWFEGGIETGEDRGKVLIVTRALFGLKSSGAAWRADLASTLRDLKFTSSQADPDVWLRSKEHITT
jgi:Reverse transcriptase (RNA-dependent DNA polymerase)